MTRSDFIEFLMILTKYVFNDSVRLTESVTVECVTLSFCTVLMTSSIHIIHTDVLCGILEKKIERHFSCSYTVELTLPEIVHHF